MEVEELKIKSCLTKYNFEKKALISILQDIQEEYNYLPQEALKIVSETLGIPLIDIVGVVTFYQAFSLEPRGKHLITVCVGTACHVRGGSKILGAFEKNLNINAGNTTEDDQFTLETVACLGCCAIGPVVNVDGNYHAQTTVKIVDSIIKKYRKKKN